MIVATPMNGARHVIEPSVPPNSGPIEIPRPTAASYKIIAFAVPPDDSETIAASAVATNKAFPSPHPPRNATSVQMLSACEAKPATVAMTAIPSINVPF